MLRRIWKTSLGRTRFIQRRNVGKGSALKGHGELREKAHATDRATWTTEAIGGDAER